MTEIIQALYEVLGITAQVTAGDMMGILSVLFLLTIGSIFAFSSPDTETEDEDAVASEQTEVSEKEPTVSFEERLNKGLKKSRDGIWGKLGKLLGSSGPSEEEMEELEELLYSADIGPRIAQDLFDHLKSVPNKDDTDLREELLVFLKNKMSAVQSKAPLEFFDRGQDGKTKTIMIVGINGAGKTTTIGKLASKLSKQGNKVVVGACDTFRAAAIPQLEIWCERAGAEIVKGKEHSDPSGVAYRTLETALAKKADYCLLDTAGRIHTKTNLMDELAKNKRVLTKLDEAAPDHVFLVIDAISGQNALKQAHEFHKTLGLTGLVLTKCDGASKAGSAVAIVEDLQVPIVLVGVGENEADLDFFDLDQYLRALLGL